MQQRQPVRLRLFPVLTALFVGLPLLDVVLLTFLGTKVGLLETVVLVVVSGVVGAWLAKSQGLRVWHGIQRDLAEGRVPAQGLMDSVIILIAGGMLMAPGFITDLLGLALLLPAVRAPIKGYLRRRLESMVVRQYGFPTSIEE